MNGYVKEIAKRLHVSLEQAKIIRDYIEDDLGIDWSEATQKEVNACMDEAATFLKIKAGN